MVQVHRLTAAAICASLGINLQAWREGVLQEVHVEVILTLHCFLYSQLEDVSEIAGGIEPQIYYRISNTRSKCKRKENQNIMYVLNLNFAQGRFTNQHTSEQQKDETSWHERF